MLKKILSICLAFCMSFSIVGVTAYAEKVSITSDTVITQGNLPDVIKYLNLDPKSVVKNNAKVTDKKVTVGELEDAIKQAKSLPNKIDTVTTGHSKPSTATKPFSTTSQGTVMLYDSINCDGFSVDYEVAGNYSGTQWTGASSASVGVTPLAGGPVEYEIGSKSLRLTWTASVITLNATVVVDTYLGLGSMRYKVGSSTVNSTCYWYASMEL